jgi:hypothetical protein
VGKSRLAIEVSAGWAGPVVWVDLAPCRDEHDVVCAVAWALGGTVEVSVGGVARALDHTEGLLVVLDNADHAPVTAWPASRLLVTSRQRMGTPGEAIVRLEPFPLPADDDDVLSSAAWRLFSAAAPPGQLPAVAADQARRLLARLDGLPLALELAAARLEILGIDSLEARLADPLATLADPERSTARGGALVSVIRGSWAQLSPGEQSILALVATFAAPVDADVVERVAGRPVLDLLHVLVRRSLLQRSGDRLGMLGSTRAFVLREGSAETWYRGHADYHAALSERLCAPFALEDPAIRAIGRPLAPELAAVVDRATDDPSLGGSAVRCARALAALLNFDAAGEPLLQVCDRGIRLGVGAEDRGWLQCLRAVALRRVGRLREARAALVALLDTPLPGGLGPNVATRLADIELESGETSAAEARFRRVLAEIEHDPDWSPLAPPILAALASTLFARDPDEADRLLARARDTVGSDRPRIALEVRKMTAWIWLERQDPRAEAEYREVAAEARRLGIERTAATAAGNAAIAAHRAGHLDRVEGFAEAERALGALGDRVYAAYYRGFGGWAALEQGRLDEGIAALRSTLTMDLPAEVVRDLQVALALGLARRGDPAAELRSAGTELAPTVAAIKRGFDAIREASPDRAALAGAIRTIRATRPADPRTARLVDRFAAELEAFDTTWTVEGDGGWVELSDGGRITLPPNRANRAILAALARARVDRPGQGLDVAELAEVGWPGERLARHAASVRVRAALSALRKLGLGDAIVRAEPGWCVDPAVPVRVIARERA